MIYDKYRPEVIEEILLPEQKAAGFLYEETDDHFLVLKLGTKVIAVYNATHVDVDVLLEDARKAYQKWQFDDRVARLWFRDGKPDKLFA